MLTANLQQMRDAFWSLTRLWSEGEGFSEEADSLRREMDDILTHLSPAEREAFDSPEFILTRAARPAPRVPREDARCLPIHPPAA